MMQVFISIALILGDGLYNFIKIIYFSALNFQACMKKRDHDAGKYMTFYHFLQFMGYVIFMFDSFIGHGGLR
jgi:hypothetical protein